MLHIIKVCAYESALGHLSKRYEQHFFVCASTNKLWDKRITWVNLLWILIFFLWIINESALYKQTVACWGIYFCVLYIMWGRKQADNDPSNDPLEVLVAYNTGPRLQVQQSTKVFVWGRETKSTADAEYKDRPVCDWGCIWRILEDWERNKFNIFSMKKRHCCRAPSKRSPGDRRTIQYRRQEQSEGRWRGLGIRDQGSPWSRSAQLFLCQSSSLV